jgi:hypothetical protein
MRQIIILGDLQRIDERLVANLYHLFPECEVHIVDALSSGSGPGPLLSPLTISKAEESDNTD